MPIFFGWGRQTTWNVGPVFKQLCSHCNNEDYWVLMRRTTWFTLFFVPIIPYNTEWLLLCPVCQYGIKLDGDQVKKFTPIAEANQLLMAGKITEEAYRAKLAIPATVVSKEEETVVEAEVKEKSIFCGDCGKELLPEGRFCVHCGTQTSKQSV